MLPGDAAITANYVEYAQRWYIFNVYWTVGSLLCERYQFQVVLVAKVYRFARFVCDVALGVGKGYNSNKSK